MQGLRATSRGGHIAIQEAAQAQFVSTVRAFKSFGRIRRARNNFEYPSTVAPGPSPDDVRDVIAAAIQARDAASPRTFCMCSEGGRRDLFGSASWPPLALR